MSPRDNDPNPFRYCAEYWDDDVQTFYLRNRDYCPRVGRFSKEDPHWHPGNMVYGDNPIDMQNDTLLPDINAISQSSNLYVYCLNNPTKYIDSIGEFAIEASTALFITVAFLAVFVSAFIIDPNLNRALAKSIAQISNMLNKTFESLILQARKKPEATEQPGETKERKKPVSGSGKEKANDVPSWARGEVPFVGESGKEFADRLLNDRFGKGNYDRGANSDHNKIKKWGDRAFK
jgi:RHS repeat-associated protein